MSLEICDKIYNLFDQHGKKDYIGEVGINQLEHALQAAYLAEQSGESSNLIVACLLHDVGHLRVFDDPTLETMGDYGVSGHENVGADWLKSLGFSEPIVEMVRNHVNCKRYNCYKHESYYNRLSDASKETLKYQGGPMSQEEALAFEKNPYFKDSMMLRVYENDAKVPNADTPSLKYFVDTYISSI